MNRYWREIEKLEAQCGKCLTCGKQLHSRVAKYCNSHKPLPHGSAHWNWRGGILADGRGYNKVYTGRVDGKTTYILEHHLIWEKENGRKLPDGYLVHHLNGIKNDNRIENLAAIRRNNHSVWTLVELAQKRIRLLEDKYEKKPELRAKA